MQRSAPSADRSCGMGDMKTPSVIIIGSPKMTMTKEPKMTPNNGVYEKRRTILC